MQLYMNVYEGGITLETLIILYVYKNCYNSDSKSVKITFVQREADHEEDVLFKTDLSEFCKLMKVEDVPEIAFYCKWPVIVVGKTVVAGLAAVSRRLLKGSNDPKALTLLGFRDGCLMACSEVSVWTKFCEIDVVNAVRNVILRRDGVMPVEVARFEYHLSQPVRIHNIYKLARVTNKDKLIKSNTPVGQLKLEHVYSEGPFMTLADLVLFPCFKSIFDQFSGTFAETFPLTTAWYANLTGKIKAVDVESDCFSNLTIQDCSVAQDGAKQTLYKPENRLRNYTRQEDVHKLVSVTKNLVVTDSVAYVSTGKFGWENLPVDANPFSGALPKRRASRKCEQLENLAKAVIKLSDRRSQVVVVDFCSGGGHLGLILACALPNSRVILVENKERSLEKARERVAKMKLTNVTMIQSNLDYFIAPFQIGAALHACGVATDLVLQSCIKAEADFVVCPCCYGGIADCHNLSYPRSRAFKNKLAYEDYLILGHASDQTHEKDNLKTSQGFACMDVIDSDRKLHAEECGYTVYLNKLNPPSCTPKNNLLIGIRKK